MTPEHLATAPRPVRRFWLPHEVPVRVTISRYWGVGVHYYAHVKESDNYVAVPEGDGIIWTRFADDTEGRGRDFQRRCDTEDAARSWARRIVAKHFRGQPVAHGSYSSRWNYREGD